MTNLDGLLDRSAEQEGGEEREEAREDGAPLSSGPWSHLVLLGIKTLGVVPDIF